jgi:phage gp37-like protein
MGFDSRRPLQLSARHTRAGRAALPGRPGTAWWADVRETSHQMLTDLLAHPDEWENTTLDRFLEALAASWEGIPGLYQNRGEQFPEAPTWKMIAEALVMASGYE